LSWSPEPGGNLRELLERSLQVIAMAVGVALKPGALVEP
jgi:hypothetical protein